MMIFIYRKVVA